MKKTYERINDFLQDQGIKQRALAEKIGVSDTVMSTMLSGIRKITADEYLAICVALDKDPNFFMKIRE